MSEVGEKCPVCGEGILYEQEEDNTILYKGRELYVTCYYSICDVCGAELANEEQMRKNKEIIIAAKREVDDSEDENRLQT